MTRGGRQRTWLVVTVALVLAPVIAAAVSIIGRHWHAGGDQALELLRIHDVGTRHTPLLGAWSRWGWAHPGPLLYVALAPFYRLFGDTGVLVGMACLNGAAIAGVVLVGYRRGGLELAALAGLATALLVRAVGLDVIVDPWNPWAAFFPFVFFLVSIWSVLCRDWVMLPLAIVAGSLVAQAHVGYLPFVAILSVVGLGYAARCALQDRGDEPPRAERTARWLVIAAVVGFGLWLPPLVQQAFGSNGNLQALASYARHPAEATAGRTLAFGTLGEELRPNGPWVTGDDNNGAGLTLTTAVWPAILLLTAMAGLAVLTWRRHRREAALLLVVGLLATGIAVLATAKITGPFLAYLTRWWWPVTAIATLGVAWALATLFDTARVRRIVTGGALAGIVVVGVLAATDVPVSLPQAEGSRAISALSVGTDTALDHRTRYLIKGVDGSKLGLVSNGLFLDLESRGFQVRHDKTEFADLQFGSWRLASADEADAVITVVDTSELATAPDPDARLIATYDPLSPEDRVRASELEARIRQAMGSRAPSGRIFVDNIPLAYIALVAGASTDDVTQLAQFQQRGDGYAVYLSAAR